LLPTGDAFGTMDAQLAAERAPGEFLAGIVTAFALGALLLAAVGAWGVTAYAVARRRFAIGVRLALGASSARLPVTFLFRALPLLGGGLVLGLAGVFGIGRVMRSQLFGVGTTDPIARVGASAILGVVTAAAVYLPARRAARVDPAVVLRTD
jgi:ABC-type antimicrobial peptide transport system permease subunit